MALFGGFFEPRQRCFEILLDPFAGDIKRAQCELRRRGPGFGRRAPGFDGGGKIAINIGGAPGFEIGCGRRGQRRDRHQQGSR